MSEDDTTDDSFEGARTDDSTEETASEDLFGSIDEDAGQNNADPFDSLGTDDSLSDTDDPLSDTGDSLFSDDGFGTFEDETDFDEEVDSGLPRIDLGVEGLDNMIRGGVPERHLITAIGGVGTGKTTFGLQFLHHGLQQGEKGVYITLEQSHEDIIDTAHERDWEFERHEAENELVVVDLDPVEVANSLENIQNELPRLISDFGADRLVLDSVSLLEMMYENRAKRRTKLYNFTRALKKAGVTAFLTSEASESSAHASRHGIIEYLTDTVFFLKHIHGESREARLAVEIKKSRNTNHSREVKPYELTDDGLSVYRQATIF
jgi:KaiC domain protein